MEKILRNKVSFNDSGMEKTGSIDNRILCIVHQLLNKTTESKLDWNIIFTDYYTIYYYKPI